MVLNCGPLVDRSANWATTTSDPLFTGANALDTADDVVNAYNDLVDVDDDAPDTAFHFGEFCYTISIF